eukprot:TRINITY_DN17861_c0_g2_i1.p1 TRINITY_DN17861_c0_g2~~TRINITY_DN17861_c0_g2_i1.p1  ORF type:complete len:221 (-),score=50.17 TRINITY_DN17861_c0_g2_i1:219-881(-)
MSLRHPPMQLAWVAVLLVHLCLHAYGQVQTTAAHVHLKLLSQMQPSAALLQMQPTAAPLVHLRQDGQVKTLAAFLRMQNIAAPLVHLCQFGQVKTPAAFLQMQPNVATLVHLCQDGQVKTPAALLRAAAAARLLEGAAPVRVKVCDATAHHTALRPRASRLIQQTQGSQDVQQLYKAIAGNLDYRGTKQAIVGASTGRLQHVDMSRLIVHADHKLRYMKH